MKNLIAFLFFPILVLFCSKSPNTSVPADERDILEKLQALEGIEVAEISPQNGYARQFEIYISQPVDHSDPAGPTFRQRVFISHNHEDRPVVFMPSGYSSSPVKVSEISGPLQANQIYAAHRFMAGAEPAPMDWQYLTIENASADFHRVVQIFREVYSGPWVSYGVSKNGQAALYHRRFYPEDVKATVAVVAALSRAEEDPRYDNFLNTAGSESDREKIKRFQRHTLTHRNDIIPMISDYMNNSSFHYSMMSAAQILEFEILEFPFSFWQITDGECSVIPDTSAAAAELYICLRNFGYFDFYSDELLEYYQPIYYQAFTELGWYRLIDDHLQDLLVAVPDPSYRLMAPPNVTMFFDARVMQDVISWLENYGNNIIYIYGENDPWTAGAIESVGSTNSLKIVQSDANHDVTIEDLDQKGLVYTTLRNWMGITINSSPVLNSSFVSR